MHQLDQLFAQLSPEAQQIVSECNYLASHLNADLVLEQFYFALDALTARLQQLLPDIACPTGCSRCCESFALPEILPAEWELIRAELESLPPAVQDLIRSAIAASTQLLDDQGQLKLPRKSQRETRCPLLVDGRCAIYAVRPFDCRITGYAFSQEGERPVPVLLPKSQAVPYSCTSEQLRMLRELSQGLHMLEYMFVPRRERLWEVLQEIEPSGGSPARLLKYLRDWSAAGPATQKLDELLEHQRIGTNEGL